MNQSPKSQAELPNTSELLSSSLSLPTQKKLEKKQLAKRFKFGWLMLGMLMGIGGGALACAWFWPKLAKLDVTLPETIEDIATYARPKTLTIKASDGSILKQIGPISHERIKLDDLPTIVPSAFLASEDSRFWQHQGIDLQGIARAALANLKAQKIVEGGSTITDTADELNKPKKARSRILKALTTKNNLN